MLENETWFEFMARAKKNGLSPTQQEEIDRAKKESEDKGVLNE